MLPEDNSAETINKKTYTRIWLQEYYRLDEYVIQNKKSFILHKKCNIIGALELAMRSYIPMYLFETIVKNYNLEYNSTDLVYLRNFSSKSLLEIAYDLSTMEMYLSKKGTKDKFTPKPIGSLVVYENYTSDIEDKRDNKNLSIKSREFNIPFLFKIYNQDKLEKDNSKQIYIISIFKAIALFIELMTIYQEKEEYEKKKEKEEKKENEEFDEEILHMRQQLKTQLVDLDLSVRALNCLKAAEVDTLGELVVYNKNDLLKFRNFGKKSLTELDELVENKGLTFGMNVAAYKLDKE